MTFHIMPSSNSHHAPKTSCIINDRDGLKCNKVKYSFYGAHHSTHTIYSHLPSFSIPKSPFSFSIYRNYTTTPAR